MGSLHNHKGNCWNEAQTAQSYLDDACPHHDEPRGECSECPRCAVCDEEDAIAGADSADED